MPHNKQGKTNLGPSFFQYFVVTKQVECPMGFFRALLVARSGHMQLVCIDTDDARNSASAQDGRGFVALAGKVYYFDSVDDEEAHHGCDYGVFSWVTRRRASPLPLKIKYI